MIENFQDKLHQAECKQSKSAKICACIRRELECEKSSKTFCQIFARQSMRNQTNAKHSINSEDVFKSAKSFLENVAAKTTPLTLPHLKFQAKLVTERTFIVATSKYQYNFLMAKISLEVHGV